MKAFKLIKYLKEFNPQEEVGLKNSNSIIISYISSDGSSKENTKQIFIEEDNMCESCFFHDGGGYCNEYGKRIENVEECFQYLEE